ncbi:hypothetical protein GYM68_08210 [Lactobacillus panisapium]|nr:hypothetical protein GYM68_08210 [Lactobacillus panisapium]
MALSTFATAPAIISGISEINASRKATSQRIDPILAATGTTCLFNQFIKAFIIILLTIFLLQLNYNTLFGNALVFLGRNPRGCSADGIGIHQSKLLITVYLLIIINNGIYQKTF